MITRPEPTDADAPAFSEQERRYLTILFADLVESTRIARDLDPEDLDELYLSYHATVRRVVEGLEGLLLKTLGDGVVAVFGYPTAHEDDAERAVRAGLALVLELPRQRIGAAPPLHLRVAIATGLTLVGRGPGGTTDVVGTTANLAARLQTLAAPDSVLISETVRELVGDTFVYEDVGTHDLKGFEHGVRAWRVLHPTPGASRFAARRRGRLPPLVGRSPALDRLRQAWQEACRGQGCSIVIVGDAGLGKSRLIHALHGEMAAGPCEFVQFNCSQLFRGSPLHPVAEFFQVASGIGAEDAPDIRQLKLADFLAERAGLDPESASFAAGRLGLGDTPSDSRGGDGRAMERLIDILSSLAVAWSKDRPLLLVLEDAHWADPTTLDFAGTLVRRLKDRRALVIVTTRPEGVGSLAALTGLTDRQPIHLSRLSRAESLAVLEGLDEGARLSADMRTVIVERSEGVPLYLEELTSTVMATGQISLPGTLEGSLMARLGQETKDRTVVQAMSVIGSEFVVDLVAELTRLSELAVGAAIARLSANELIFTMEGPGGSIGYGFRHALLEQAIYESIPRKRRRMLHLRAADVIRTLRPQIARRFPEMVAEHLTRGGNAAEASEQWLLAGRRAAEQSAVREAEQHLVRGLDLLAEVADPTHRLRLELEMQLALGPVLIATHGPASKEVEQAYSRARELAPRRFETLWGQWRTEVDNDKQLALARELLTVAEASTDVDLRLQVHHALWASDFNSGDLEACLDQIRAGLSIYDPQRHLPQAIRFGGHDAACCAYGVATLAHWARGETRQAQEAVEHALSHAADLGHALSRAHALDFAITFAHHGGDARQVEVMANELAGLARDKGLSHTLSRARIFAGWAAAMAGEVDRGVAAMREGIEHLGRVGDEEDFTVFITLLAEGIAAQGRFADALACLAELDKPGSHRSGVRYWDAEILRLQGSWKRRLGHGAEARDCFERAVALARRHRFPMPGLRAALSLADLLDEQGRAAEARTVLAAAIAALPSEAEGSDVDAARARLAALDGVAGRGGE